MEWLTSNIELIIAGITLLLSSGLVVKVKNAVKESKEAFEKGEEIYNNIQLYKKNGFSNKEMSKLMNQFEDFYKEGKEAYLAIDSVWKLLKTVIKKKTKK